MAQIDNDLYRGPTELVQHFANRGIHIGARALLEIFIDMLWLNRSPFPVGRGGDFTCSNDLTCLRGA